MSEGNITPKQKEILEYIKDQILTRGFPPAVREICEAVNLKSTSSVHSHLETLEKNGYIRRDPTKPRAIEILDDNFNLTRREMVNIPIIGRVAAGEPLLAEQNIEDYFPIPVEYMPNKQTFMLQVQGESMINAGILSGDYVIVEQTPSAENGEQVVALIEDGATVKTFYREEGIIRLQPENDAYDPIILTDVVTACASGSNSIGDALRAIQYGDLDVCVAGGTESCICPTGIAGFTALTALSTNEDPMTASRPFDQDRDGFVLGEGAGIVVLEELEHAKARGAKIYAELAGYGSTGDAYHITSPAENGEGAGMAMKLAMKEAGVAPEEVDYINAHGTSTHHNDLFETRAICYALGDAAENVVVNSTKSMIGHLLGAAGAVEFVVCVKSILDNFIHQTVGTKNVDPECGLNYAVGAPVEKEVNCVISNSLGFGGHNVSLLVKRFEE